MTELSITRHGAQRMGFFTDTTVCIGCKACEVACKQWNDLPADELRVGQGFSYDYTRSLSASTWRHVADRSVGFKVVHSVLAIVTRRRRRNRGSGRSRPRCPTGSCAWTRR